MSEPKKIGGVKLTQSMTMHMNGGNKFSELHYEILANGKPTGIMRYKRTNGSPRYLLTDDHFVYKDETFDVLATKGIGMMEWLEERAQKNEPTQTPD